MLRTRLITGTLLIAGVLALVWGDQVLSRQLERPGILIFAVTALLLIPILGRELAAMYNAAGLRTTALLTTAAGWCGLFATAGIPGSSQAAAETATVAMALIAAIAFIATGVHRETRGATAAAAGTVMAFLLIGVLVGFWMLVRIDFSGRLFVACILVVKASDTGAYFTGRIIGRHKLIPWISPGKTWEGFAGGVAAAALAAMAFALAWQGDPGVPAPGWALLGGAILGVAGPFGDLAESLMKRDAGLKDAGRVLPGMGGLFDMLDSLLFAGPVAWLLLRRAVIA